MMRQNNDLPDRLHQIMTWLSQGWQIEEPVLQRTILHGAAGSSGAFEVVMRRNDERRVLALNASSSIEDWLAQRSVSVLNI